jgi:hypothetical protein
MSDIMAFGRCCVDEIEDVFSKREMARLAARVYDSLVIPASIRSLKRKAGR